MNRCYQRAIIRLFLSQPTDIIRGFRVSSILVCLFAIFIALQAQAQTLYIDEQFDFQQTSSVLFATKPVDPPPSTIGLYLELFQPAGPGTPQLQPGIILIHGGGFTNGSRFAPRLITSCERMARRGYTCVSIDYRLHGDNPVIDPAFSAVESKAANAGFTYPTAVAAAVEDSWAAYNWMITNAAGLDVNPEKIGIGGTSAGAITSLFISYVLDEIGIALPNSLKAVFSMWGTFGTEELSLMEGVDAPIFVTHGENDSVFPVTDAYAIINQANTVNLAHQLHVEPGAGHGFDIFTATTASGKTVFEEFVEFFFQYVVLDSEAVAVPILSAEWIILLFLVFIIIGTILIRSRAASRAQNEF